MKDVANLAGVGVGTVSRMINGTKVKDETFQKVTQAIQELDFIPDETARGLKRSMTHTVALILPTIWHPFFSEFAYYVEKFLSQHNYKLYLCNSDGQSEKEAEYVKLVDQNRCDGIIAITYTDIEHYISDGLPFVSIDRLFTHDVAYVASDNKKIGQLAYQVLKESSVSHFAYVGSHNRVKNRTMERGESFEAAVLKSSALFSKLDMLEPVVDNKTQIKAFLLENPSIDGIFAINDYEALDVLAVLTELGRKVPEDVQVLGCDGIKMSAEREYVVSTIKQPTEAMAKSAVDMVLALAAGEETVKEQLLDVSYIKYQTTK
ncbi:LacI family DNA-binding transcriptional regulator [Lactococcus paracarnosus]|uniref:LacI family DNA-binding transcriptional regulator n=1 Tax=Pseudolactococcus paracarnosus TaxID=2749962 RepID=A0ABT0AK89_9LACT|nr:LacI family DNA-binding transcriptional regulator [Lactococcus paracarnosus]MCJ1976940.1 LacI family DNA-binding transcriptional regulator [Lactococcus paracarnosus]MCJ1983351.1 LacI family DNA-binding transcriptional regulator [Lactococcus paracarnosus]MCJ1998444.1 LacI family DNA-binding transcriptional regulator [Lactococcus paracarnosus]